VQGRAVDARTDIFSLGVVLYELATGRRPFQSDSAAGLMSAILRDAPTPVGSLRPGLPPSIEGSIERCLEKDPAARFQIAGEVRLALSTASPAESRFGPIPSDEPPWIAVLPLEGHRADPDLETVAAGLSEDITTGLSRFSHLHVVSRQSTLRYAGGGLDVRALSRELGARYALDGAVRKAGSALRVSVQLLDTATGTNLWAESYDRDLAASAIFAIQDDLTDRIVATVADPYGVLVRSMASAIRGRPLQELTASQLVLRFFAYWHQVRPEEHARLRSALESRLEREPAHADARACLARLYSHEVSHRLNPLPGSLERALREARFAIEVDPTCQMGWESLADASYMAGEMGGFRTAAERAMALNPRNTNTMATMAVLLSNSGEADRGLDLARRAMILNPHHPGWYHVPLVFDHYRKGEYAAALEETKRMQMPEFFWSHLAAAAAAGRLGREDDCRVALEALRRLSPDYRRELEWYGAIWSRDPAFWEKLLKGFEAAETLVGERAERSEGP
jgi:TolB-like protein